MPTRLEGLQIDEISLVDAGANPGADVVLAKRKGGERLSWVEKIKKYFNKPSYKSFDMAYKMSNLDDKWYKMQNALRESVESAMGCDEYDKGMLIKGCINSFMEKVLKELDEMEEPGEMAMAMESPIGKLQELVEQEEIVFDDVTKSLQELESIMKVEKGSDSVKVTIEDVLKGIENDEHRRLIQDAIAKNEVKEPEEIDKAELSEPVRKRLEALESQTEQLKKIADDATAIAKAEREKREWNEFVIKAKELPLVGAADEVAKDLKEAYAVSEEFGKRVEERFKAANERLEKSDLFKEVGTSASGDGESKLEKLAKQYQEQNPSVTSEQAYAEVTKRHPELLNAELKGVK